MTLLYTDRLFLDHATGNHPENPTRLIEITRHLQAIGLSERCVRPAFGPVAHARLARVHQPGYIAEIADFVARGGGVLEADTVVGPKSLDAALLAAGAAVDAVERVVRGEDEHGALPRPAAGASCPARRRDGLLPVQQRRRGGRGWPSTNWGSIAC